MKAIPTLSNGTTYVSRLEARWSVVFDCMQLHYTYEPEGWQHDGKLYLPDFWVDEWKAYVAIKPRVHDKASQTALDHDLDWQRELFFAGEELWCIVGDPVAGGYRLIVPTVLGGEKTHRDATEEIPIDLQALIAAMRSRFGQKHAGKAVA